MNVSEGKKFPWIEGIYFSEYFKQFLELYTGGGGGVVGYQNTWNKPSNIPKIILKLV